MVCCFAGSEESMIKVNITDVTDRRATLRWTVTFNSSEIVEAQVLYKPVNATYKIIRDLSGYVTSVQVEPLIPTARYTLWVDVLLDNGTRVTSAATYFRTYAQGELNLQCA